MSKTKDWLMELEEDAATMTKADFLKRHGEHYEDMWEEVNNPQEYPSPPDDYVDDNKLMENVKCIGQ
tara:strand:- start:189 stop:389 length:201 start_codon:yes stop_codon:yes gene_type:complete